MGTLKTNTADSMKLFYLKIYKTKGKTFSDEYNMPIIVWKKYYYSKF